METNLELANFRLRQAMIIAPISGRVASLLIGEGEQVAPGAPAINLVNEEAFHIEVNGNVLQFPGAQGVRALAA